MALKREKMPRTASSLRIRKAVIRLTKLPIADRIQLMVKAKLLTQEQADEAKARLAEKEKSADLPASP